MIGNRAPVELFPRAPELIEFFDPRSAFVSFPRGVEFGFWTLETHALLLVRRPVESQILRKARALPVTISFRKKPKQIEQYEDKCA
jgi:hypothetical protein